MASAQAAKSLIEKIWREIVLHATKDLENALSLYLARLLRSFPPSTSRWLLVNTRTNRFQALP